MNPSDIILINGLPKRCMKCGFDLYPEAIEIHHIVPLTKGGKDNLSNVTLLCANCHRHAHKNHHRLPISLSIEAFMKLAKKR